MIQINLIPDVKREMLRAQRVRNMAISLSILAGMVAAGVVVALLLVLGAQTALEKLHTDSIKKGYATLSETEDLNNALTIQQQLGSISGMHDKKTINSRIFDVLLAINPSEPNNVKLSKVTIDPEQKQLILEGSAEGGYTATETFRKTILNAKVVSRKNGDEQKDTKPDETPLTSEVTLQNTSYSEDADGKKVVTFTVSFTYPEGLFDNTITDVQIKRPDAQIDVTDSKERVPDSMFGAAPVKTEETK